MLKTFTNVLDLFEGPVGVNVLFVLVGVLLCDMLLL